MNKIKYVIIFLVLVVGVVIQVNIPKTVLIYVFNETKDEVDIILKIDNKVAVDSVIRSTYIAPYSYSTELDMGIHYIEVSLKDSDKKLIKKISVISNKYEIFSIDMTPELNITHVSASGRPIYN